MTCMQQPVKWWVCSGSLSCAVTHGVIYWFMHDLSCNTIKSWQYAPKTKLHSLSITHNWRPCLKNGTWISLRPQVRTTTPKVSTNTDKSQPPAARDHHRISIQTLQLPRKDRYRRAYCISAKWRSRTPSPRHRLRCRVRYQWHSA